MTQEDLYAELGLNFERDIKNLPEGDVRQNGTRANKIRSAFRAASKSYHPDNRETGDEARFKRINNAHEILGDPVKRASYDRLNGFSTGSRNHGSGFRPPPNHDSGPRSQNSSQSDSRSPRVVNGAITGSVSHAGPIIVNGTVMGNVKSDSYIEVNGQVMGNVTAQGDIIVEGTIMGNASAGGEIRGSGDVLGNRTSGVGTSHQSTKGYSTSSSSGFSSFTSGSGNQFNIHNYGNVASSTSTDGSMIMSNTNGISNSIITNATRTTITRAGIKLEVTGPHEIRNGVIIGGSVKFNGQNVPPQNGVVDLSSLDSGLAKEFGAGQSKRKGRGI